jgi:hypothetical protein
MSHCESAKSVAAIAKIRLFLGGYVGKRRRYALAQGVKWRE